MADPTAYNYCTVHCLE